MKAPIAKHSVTLVLIICVNSEYLDNADVRVTGSLSQPKVTDTCIGIYIRNPNSLRERVGAIPMAREGVVENGTPLARGQEKNSVALNKFVDLGMYSTTEIVKESIVQPVFTISGIESKIWEHVLSHWKNMATLRSEFDSNTSRHAPGYHFSNVTTSESSTDVMCNIVYVNLGEGGSHVRIWTGIWPQFKPS